MYLPLRADVPVFSVLGSQLLHVMLSVNRGLPLVGGKH